MAKTQNNVQHPVTGNSLPKDPNLALMDMIKTVRTLKQVVEKETDVLSKTDIPAFMNLQDEKLQAARKYQDHMSELMARKDQIKLAKSEMKKALVQSQKEFHSITQKNVQMLERMGKGAKRLNDRIMNIARTEAARQNQVAYGSSGRISGRDKASMGVNESA